MDKLEFGLTGRKTSEEAEKPHEDLEVSNEIMESGKLDRSITELSADFPEEDPEFSPEALLESRPEHQPESIIIEKKIDVDKTIETIRANMSHSLSPRYEEVIRWVIKQNKQNSFISSEIDVKGTPVIASVLKKEKIFEVVDTAVIFSNLKRNTYRINPRLIIWDGEEKEEKKSEKDQSVSGDGVSKSQKIEPDKQTAEKIWGLGKKVEDLEQDKRESEKKLKDLSSKYNEMVEEQRKNLEEAKEVTGRMKGFVREATPPLPREVREEVISYHKQLESISNHLRELDIDIREFDNKMDEISEKVNESSEGRIMESDLEKAMEKKIEILEGGIRLFRNKIMEKNYKNALAKEGEFLIYLENFVFENFHLEEEYVNERRSEQDKVGMQNV